MFSRTLTLAQFLFESKYSILIYFNYRIFNHFLRFLQFFIFNNNLTFYTRLLNI